MATALKRFDGKLDALLRKNLSFELYERLIAIESCIVVTHGGKKALRHVILGHTELYFAEVPPKSLKRALRLNDVLSVNTVDDVPSFLSDKENTVHIQVIYNIPVRTEVSPGFLRRLGKTKNSQSLSPLVPVANEGSRHRSQSVSPRLLQPIISNKERSKSRSLTPELHHTPGLIPSPQVSRSQTKAKDKRLLLLRSHEQSTSNDSLWSSTLSLASMESLDNSSNTIPSVDERAERKVTLDLYVLGKHTNLCHDFNIVLEDLRMESKDDVTDHSYSDIQDSLTSHFLCLKTELLDSKDYKTIADVIVELSQAATKYYILKRLFWQDSELIEYCIYQMNTIKETICNNLDCIEYNVIISELLLIMFNETHICTNRTTILIKNRGSIMERLTYTVLNTFSEIQKGNDEMNKLVIELTDKVTSVLYELMRTTSQSCQSECTISWFSEIISVHQYCLCFLTHVTSRICDITTTNNPIHHQVVTLYRLISFLNLLIRYSYSGLKICQMNFSEEFRYIIHLSNIESHQLYSVISEKLHYIKSIVNKYH